MSTEKRYQSLGRITNVEDQGSCLVLWIEPRTELVLQVERAIERFSKSYSCESVPTCKQSLQIGQMVCVSVGGADQSWLRAEVVNLQEGSAYPYIQLFLVDSGRTRQAELKELRLLQAHDQLLKLEPLALRYVLAGVAPADTETCAWQPDFVKSLHETLTAPMVMVNYRVEGDEKTPHLVAVWFNGVDLSTWLVGRGSARSVSCEYQLERLSLEAVEVCRAQPLTIGPLAAERNTQTPTVEWAQEKQPGGTDSSSPQNPNPFKWISQKNTSSNTPIENGVKFIRQEKLINSAPIPSLQIDGPGTQSTSKSDPSTSAPRNTSPSQTRATVVSEQTSPDTRAGAEPLGDGPPAGGSQTANPYRRQQESVPQDAVVQASGGQPRPSEPTPEPSMNKSPLYFQTGPTNTRELKQEAIHKAGLSYPSMGTAPHPTALSQQALSPSAYLGGSGMQPRFFPSTFPAPVLQHIPPSAQARQQLNPFPMCGQLMAPPSGFMGQQQGNPSQQLVLPLLHLTGGADTGLMPGPAGPPQAWQLAMLAQAQAMQGPRGTQQRCEPALQQVEGYQKLALKPGMEYRAVVCHVGLSGTLPWTFSCQLEHHQPLLQQINNAAQQAWAALTEPAIIPGDRPLLARYAANSLWYRATVVKHHSPRRVTVRFADFGNEAEVRSTDTRETPPWPVFQHPALAFTCRLQLADTLEHAPLSFSRLTLNRPVIVRTLHELPGGEVLVRVFEPATQPPRDIALSIVVALEESVALSSAPLEPSEERASKPSVPGSVIDCETIRTISCNLMSSAITAPTTWKDRLLQLQSGTERAAQWCLQQQTHLLDDGAGSGREQHPASQASDAGSRGADSRWDRTAEAPGTSRGSRVQPRNTMEPASTFDTVSVCRQSQKGSDSQEEKPLSRKDQFRSENAEPVIVQPLRLWPGEVLPHAVMSSAKSPSELHVQLSQNPELAELHHALQAAARHAPALERVSPGDFCLARWPSDKKWYRGKVELSGGSTCVVYLLDYGDRVQVEEIRALPAALSEYPAQALCCSLRGVRPARGANTWSTGQMTKLRSILNNQTFMVKIAGVDEDGGHSVVFYGDDNTPTPNEVLGASRASLAPLQSLPQPPPPSGRVVVSHFVNPHDFYTVPVTREPDRIKLETEAQLQVYPTPPPPAALMRPGLLVLAQYEDSRWYRARLMDNRGNLCELLLVDSGITWVTASSHLALLPDSLRVEAPFAVPCRLAGVLPPPRGPDWLEGRRCDEKVAQVFDSRRTFLVQRCGEAQGNQQSVDLIMEQDKSHLAEVLVARGLAVRDAATHDEERLGSGGSCRVEVSHVEMDLSFFVQPLSVAGQLRQLSQEMAQLDSAPREVNLANLAAAKSSLDGGWHRVLVVSPPAPQDDVLTVMFVDYGNTEQVARDMLKRLPARLSELRPLATRCHLPLRIRPRNTPAAISKLKKLLAAAGNEGVIQVLCRLPGGTLVVELMLGDASVSAVLEEAGLAQSLLEPVYVSAASSSSHFFMQLVKQEKRLTQMEKYLMEIAQSQPPFTHPKPGLRCMARYDDSWCRVRVLSTTARACEVQYLDHGNTARVTELRALPADLKATKKFALECTLRRPACNKEEEERFLKITQDESQELVALMPEHFDRTDPIQVVLLLDGEDVMPAPLWEVEKEEADLRVLLGLQEPAQRSETASDALDTQKECSGKMEQQQSESSTTLVRESECVTNAPGLLPIEAPEAARLAEQQPTKSTGLTDVYVSFYESPCSVWVNQVSDAAKVEEVQTRLPSELGCTPLDLTALLGCVCAARQKQDSAWYRARLLQIDPPRVLYIDFGNTDGDVEELRCLSEVLSELPPLALRFALRLAPRDENSCRRLRELLSDDSTVFQAELSDLEAVGMFVNGKDIYQLIEYTPPATTDFTISHFESVDHFYIQLDSDMPELERMQNRLNEEDGEPLHCAEVGAVCLGKFPSDSSIDSPFWYRVRVLLQTHSESNDALQAAGSAPNVIETAEESTDMRRSEVTALLLDYGNEGRISELRHLPLDFAELAPLAIQCKLVVPSQNPLQKASLETLFKNAATTVFQAVLPSQVDGVKPLVLERVWLQGRDLVALAARDFEELGPQEPIAAPETPQSEGEKVSSSEDLTICEDQPGTENIPFSAEYNLTEADMTADHLNLEKYDGEAEKASPNFDQSTEMLGNCIKQYQTVDDLLPLEETQQEQNITGILKPGVSRFNSSAEPMVGEGILDQWVVEESSGNVEGILAVASSESVSSHSLNVESEGGALSDQSTETDVGISPTPQHRYSPDEELINPFHQVLSSLESLCNGKSSPQVELMDRTSPLHRDVIDSVSSSDLDFTECLSSLDLDFTECISSPELDPTADDLSLPEEEITEASPVEDSIGNDSPLGVNPTEVASYSVVDSTTSTSEGTRSSPLQQVLLFPEYSKHSLSVDCEEKMASETEIPSLDDVVDLTDLFVSSLGQLSHSVSDSDIPTSCQADTQANLKIDLKMVTNSSSPSNSTATDPWSLLLAEDDHQEQLQDKMPLLLPLPAHSIVKDSASCLDSKSLDCEADCLDDSPTQAHDASSLEEPRRPSHSSSREEEPLPSAHSIVKDAASCLDSTSLDHDEDCLDDPPTQAQYTDASSLEPPTQPLSPCSSED